MRASRWGHKNVVGLLVQAGADLNDQSNCGDAAIMRASENGYGNVVRFLADKGAELEIRNVRGWTPIMFASSEGHEDVVKILIEKGANANVQDKIGNTAFSLALSCGKLLIREYLDKKLLTKLLKTLRSSASKDADIFDDRLYGAVKGVRIRV